MRFFSKMVLVSLWVFFASSNVYAQYKDASNEFSYALKLYDQEFYDLAAQQFITFYSTYKGSHNAAEAKFYAGMSLFKLKQYNKARVEFQSLALEFPQNPKAAESWYLIGESYEKLNNYSEAAKAYETLKTLYPNHAQAAEALFKAGKNYSLLENHQKAKSVFRAILDRYVESTFYYPALLELATLSQVLNKPEQAQIYIDKVLRNSTKKEELAQAYYLQGKLQFQHGYMDPASKAFTKILSDYNETEYNKNAALYLGRIALQDNRYSAASKFFMTANEATKDSEEKNVITQLLGDSYFLNKQFSLAQKAYAKLAITDNDSLKLVIGLKKALSLKNQGLQSKARAEMAALVNSTEITSGITLKVAEIYIDWLIEGRKTNEAVNFILQKIKQFPAGTHPFLLINKLGQASIKAKRWHDIVREIKPYVNMPASTEFKDDYLFYLATAYYELGKFEDSAYHLDLLLKQFSGSTHYSSAREKFQELQDFKLVDQSLALRSLAAIIGDLASDKVAQEIPLKLGKVYFNDLKDYQNARIQFEDAVQKDMKHKGDAYLYLGKSFLMLSESPGKGEAESQKLLQKASQNFQLAVENLATCSKPDEASWLMVRTGVVVDTISIEKQKKYIETLIAKYPKSTLKESWLNSLAHDLAFSPKHIEQSNAYFKQLIKNYKHSADYPTYLYGYGKLINEQDNTKSLELFKTIALDYSDAPEAVRALNEVALYYEQNNQYKEAAQLYTMLLEKFYYSDFAQNAAQKLGELDVRAGQYAHAVNLLQGQVSDPFINDLVLSKTFLSSNIKQSLVYMGIASQRLGKNEKAQYYLNQYLTHAPNGQLKNTVSFELAELYLAQNRNKLALDHFKNISKQDSSLYNRALIYQANILFEDKKYKEAARVYAELEKQKNTSQIAREVKGKFIICKIKTGAIAESEKQIKAFRKAFPDDKEYLATFTLELGEFQRMNKNFDKALKFYKTVKKKYSKTSVADDAEYYTALTYVTLNKNKEAFDILTQFYSNFNGSDKLAAVLNTLGTLYFRVEKYDNAISAFKNALQRSTDDYLSGQIIGNLIKTYSLTGFWDAAQGLARTYVEKYPDAEDIIDKQMIIAQAFTNLNQFQNAVDYLKRMKLTADSEKEPEIQFYIGEALLKAGRYEEAIAEFVKIPLLSKKTKLQWEASALYYSGQAYEKLGRLPDAVRMYKEIIKRPGIDLILKRDAEKRIVQIQG